jgi:WD40-like Beta Propeller Repeat
MTIDDRFGRDLSAWLHEDGERRVPDHLAEVLVHTVTTRQRPWWSSPERWLPVDTTFRPRFVTWPRPGRVLLVAALIALLAMMAILAVGSRQRLPEPFGLARNGAILDWGDGDIYLAGPDGSDPRPIVTGPDNDFAPILARDGTRMVFSRVVADHEAVLMTAAVDGSSLGQALDLPFVDADWFEWSADDRLAVVHSVADRRVVSIVDLGARTSTDLDIGGLDVDNDVYWLPPDAQRVVFTARPHQADDSATAIYSIGADGTGFTRLTPVVTEPAHYNGLDVSPDGRYVSYWNYEPDASAAGMGSHIHFLDLRTGTEQRMTFDPTAAGETDLRFSPDATHVVLQREAGASQLMIASTDGSNQPLLVGPEFSLDAEPAYGFAPDGKTVVLAFEGSKPWFFDVGTGTVTRGPAPLKGFGGYQRLAP